MEWVFLILYKIFKRIPNKKPRKSRGFLLKILIFRITVNFHLEYGSQIIDCWGNIMQAINYRLFEGEEKIKGFIFNQMNLNLSLMKIKWRKNNWVFLVWLDLNVIIVGINVDICLIKDGGILIIQSMYLVRKNV